MNVQKIKRLYLKTLTTHVVYRTYTGTGAPRVPTDTACAGKPVATNSPSGNPLVSDKVENVQSYVVYKDHLPGDHPSTSDYLVFNGKQYAIVSFTPRTEGNVTVAYDIKVKG